MPRPKRKSGITNFSALPHPLSAKAREDITIEFGIDRRVAKGQKTIDEFSSEIEKWLGFYFEAKLASAQLPRIADYKRELSTFQRDTSAYLEKIRNYPNWVRDTIDECDGTFDQLERDLVALVDATVSAAEPYVEKESRGRKKNEARLKLIQQLKLIFTKYSVKGKYKATTAKIKRDRKYAEQNFVEAVFIDADIPVPKTLARMLRAR